jgi:hypothetical protein
MKRIISAEPVLTAEIVGRPDVLGAYRDHVRGLDEQEEEPEQKERS